MSMWVFDYNNKHLCGNFKEMADTPESKSYTVTFEGDDIVALEKMSASAGLEPEELLHYAFGAYTFITLAIAQGSTLYLDDAEIILDTKEEEEEIEFLLETGDEDDDYEDLEEEGSRVKDGRIPSYRGWP